MTSTQIYSPLQRLSFRLLAIVAFALLAMPVLDSRLAAQSNYGAIRGTISDTQGAALDKAQVILTSDATKLARTTVSNGSGEYLFGAVDPGVYTVTVDMSGFQKLERKGIIVDSGNTIPLDIALSIGSDSQIVEVDAAEPLINAGTSYNGQLIDSQKLQNLPNPGRNPFLFSKLDNSVTAVGDPRFVRFQDQSGSSTISIAGAPLSSNNYSVDGVPITDFSNRAVIIPSIEAVDEVKVQANTYDGEIGRTSGGMFNTTLHSGSSTLHGVLQGETRQTNWGANLFFNNRTAYRDPITGVTSPTTPRGAAEFYSYVGAIGGPIPLPQKLGGKDKTFFWITEEGYRQRSPLTASNAYVVPTALQRGTSITDAGNFSEIGTVTNGACTSGICIKNPLTGAYFPNNTIPSGLINTVGYNILSYYPAPNTAVTAYGTPNFFGVDTLGDRADEFVGKLDHQFSSRLASEVYYMHYGSKEPGGNSLESLAGSSSSYLLYRKVDALGIQNTFTLNPTTVITAGFGFNRFPNNTLDISNGFDQTKLGFPSSYVSAFSKSGFPQIQITSGDTGLSPEGTSNSGPAVYFSRNFVTGVSKSLGKHSLKAGYVFRAISLTFTSLSTTDGTFTFDNTLSGATAADLLLGYPTSGSLIIPAKLAITTQYNAIYLQDDWRIMPKLTLNLGVRYEHEPGVHERSNHYSVGFDRTATYNAFGGAVPATGGVEFAGQNGYPTSTGNTVNKFSPRIGFAYSVDPQTVVRGGFGVFYQPLVYSGSASYAPGYVLTNSIPSQSGVPTISLSNPYPSLSTTASGNTFGLSTSIGSTLTVVDQNRKAPLYQSYSADIQRDLPYGIALKIGYVGGHGRNQPDALNINQLGDANYSLGGQLDTKVTNPYAGLGFWSNGKQSYNQTIRPFPQFQSITDSESVGYSNYNALDIKVQKRLSQGVSVLAAFTWSSNWDNLWGASDTLNPGNNGPQDSYNLKPEYSRAINDIPKRTTFAVTYDLPFGHGKTFLGGSNRWLDLAVGGWKFNDIMIIQDGGPLPITQVSSYSVTTTSGTPPVSTTTKFNTSNASYGNSTLRPTLVPGVAACYSGAPEGRLGGSGATPYFNAAAFTPTLSKSYGNTPRTVGCYGPGYLNTDLSLNKNFKLTERVNAEFRAEALNAFNTPEFNGPNLSVGSSSAGQITGTLGFPRLIQLGGRLTF